MQFDVTDFSILGRFNHYKVKGGVYHHQIYADLLHRPSKKFLADIEYWTYRDIESQTTAPSDADRTRLGNELQTRLERFNITAK